MVKTKYKQLENELEEILSELEIEEILAYYRNIHKKLLETYPTLYSEWNIEERNKLLDSINEATDIFKVKYPSINIANLSILLEEFEKIYLNENDLSRYSLLTANINALSSQIAFLVIDVRTNLGFIYNYYSYAANLGVTALKKEMNIPEELLEPLEPYFNDKNNSSFYGFKALSYLIFQLEADIPILERYIEEFKTFNRLDFIPEDTPEDLAEILRSYVKIYDSTNDYIKEYEEIKKNPFKQAIEVQAYLRKKNNFPEFDSDTFISSRLASAPIFDFEKFELIIPTETGDVN